MKLFRRKFSHLAAGAAALRAVSQVAGAQAYPSRHYGCSSVLPPADFGKLIAGETEKWAKVVKFSGAKPE